MSKFKYLSSLFSPQKLSNRRLSFWAIWDNESEITNRTEIERFVRMNKVKIGRYSRLDHGCQVINATIGNFTAIGPNTKINLGSHPMNYLTTHGIFYNPGNWGWHEDWVQKLPDDFEEMPHVKIGSDVWIGSEVIIMGGVTIGDGAIIAAGAIVTKDIPPFAIAGGVPAKVIKYRYPEDMIAKLQEVKWWDLSDDEITKRIQLFHTPNPTLEDIEKYFNN